MKRSRLQKIIDETYPHAWRGEITMPNETRRTPDSPEDLAHRFTYHSPEADPGAVHFYADVRAVAHRMAQMVVDGTPPSRERSLALTKIEEAVMWANAARARNGAIFSRVPLGTIDIPGTPQEDAP